MKRRLLILIISIFVFAWTSASQAEEIGSRTDIYVLVDLSATWFNQGRINDIKNTLGEINKAVVNLGTRSEKPVLIYYLPITDSSMVQNLLCQGKYQPALINRRGGNTIGSKSELEKRLDLCRDHILNQNPAAFTDISGSIDLAVQISRSSTDKKKYMIIASDLKEESRKGAVLPTLNVDKFKIALVYRILPEDSLNLDIKQRLSFWTQKLVKAKAVKVVSIIDKGNVGDNIVTELLSNGN